MRLKMRNLLMIATLLPLLVSEGMLNFVGMTAKTLGYIRLLDCCLVVALFALYRQMPSRNAIILSLIYGMIVFSSAFNHSLNLTILNISGGVTACLTFDLWMKKYFDRFMRILHFFLCFLVIANFASILLFPDGMYSTRLYTQNWILGYKNSHLDYIMLAAVIDVIQSYRGKGKITWQSTGFLCLCCLSLLIVDSLMGFVIVFLFSAVAIFLINHSHSTNVRLLLKLVDLKTWIALTLVAFLLVVVMYNNSTLLTLMTRLSNAMGRSTPFNGRVPIWTAAMKMIGQSPLLGYGSIDPSQFVKMSGIWGGTHAHNYILNILIMGGFPCLLLHIWLYGGLIRQIDRTRSFAAYVMSAVIGVYFFAGITNVNFYSVFFNVLFVVAYHVIRRCDPKAAVCPQDQRRGVS